MTLSALRPRPKRRPASTVVCHYCNQPDGRIVQDGTLREWQCTQCLSTNYYDEHGQISDPPNDVVTSDNHARYAYAHTTQPNPTLAVADNPFCETCIKNQHLYTASLAQYHVSLPETEDPAVEEQIQQRIKQIEANLADRYPQLCAACEPKVVERIKRGHYKAQTDNLGRILQRVQSRTSAASRAEHNVRTRVWGEVFYALGRLTWWLAVFLQLTWTFLTLLDRREAEFMGIGDDEVEGSGWLLSSSVWSSWSPLVIGTVEPLQPFLPLISRSAVVAGLLSCTWNPQHKPGSLQKSRRAKEWHHHWFKLQIALVAIRLLLLYFMSSDMMVLGVSITSIMHVLAVPFVISIVTKALGSLRSELRQGLTVIATSPQSKRTAPLLKGIGSLTAERLPKASTGSGIFGLSLEDDAPSQDIRGLSEADAQHATTLESPYDGGPKSWTNKIQNDLRDYGSPKALLNMFNSSLGASVDRSSTQGSTPASPTQPTRINTFLTNMTSEQGNAWLRTGELPEHMLDEMDWESAPIEHQFKPQNQPQVGPFAPFPLDRISKTPAEPSPFRKPVPAAPHSWARRIYNPPVPRPEPPSAPPPNPFAAQSSSRGGLTSTFGETHYPELAQQRFFYDPQNIPIDRLADQINDFNIDLSPVKNRGQRGQTRFADGSRPGQVTDEGKEGERGLARAALRFVLQLAFIVGGAQLLVWTRGEATWHFWAFVVFLVGLMAHRESLLLRN